MLTDAEDSSLSEFMSTSRSRFYALSVVIYYESVLDETIAF